ncbi:hypothetical protein ACH0CP_02715 [Sphingomonas sp. 179-I 2A4 NHS]|uniref:hypothetical protein n=1 Tax=unclassified Sphingomonas TaxID=196159 RepID=UPI00387A4B6C
MIEPSADELTIYDDISKLGERLWKISTSIEGLNTDPKMSSIMLYKRLWSNQRGYTALWKMNLNLEANIVLRSAVEAAICIAANAKLREEFVLLMSRDAAATIQGQIKIHRDNEAYELVKEGEATLRLLQSKLPVGVKPATLRWKELAEQGGAPQLYSFHKMLSSVSSHVTGLSILRGVTNERMDAEQREISELERKMHLMMMAGAMLQGARLHSVMIEAYAELEIATILTDRLATLSMSWPGVGPDD